GEGPMLRAPGWRPVLVASLFPSVYYVAAGGRFRAAEAKPAITAAIIALLLGLPCFWLCRLAVWYATRAAGLRGHFATAAGVVLSFLLIILLGRFVPPAVGISCLSPGLIGGILGALEAKDLGGCSRAPGSRGRRV